MREKTEILEDSGDARNGLKLHAVIEVLIDIRDVLVETNEKLKDLVLKSDL